MSYDRYDEEDHQAIEAAQLAKDEQEIATLPPKLQQAVRDILQTSIDYSNVTIPGWAWVHRQSGYVSWQTGSPIDTDNYCSVRLPQGGRMYFAELETHLDELHEFLGEENQ